MEEENKSKLEKLGLGKNIKTLVLVVGLIAIPVVLGGLAQAQNIRNQGNSEVLAAEEADEIITKVGALMELPNEEPTVATVSDVNSLRDQQFFQKAQNGDKVIIFPNAQKAILYRPESNKIIEIALYTPPTPSQEPVVQDITPTPQSIRDLVGDEEPTPEPDATGTLTPTSTPGPTLPL